LATLERVISANKPENNQLATHRRNCSYKFFGMNVTTVYSAKDVKYREKMDITEALTGCPNLIPHVTS